MWCITIPAKATTWALPFLSGVLIMLAYYRLIEDDKRYYMDYTGTGNTLNAMHAQRTAPDDG